jgi:GntR family transcriptional regulator
MEHDFVEGIPFYYQIKNDLTRRILAGEFGGGDQLPGEVELAAAYGVSRPTVRQAIQVLVQDGLVVRRKGKGTFVQLATFVDNAEMFSLFTDQATGADATEWSEVVEVHPARPDAHVAAALGLDRDAAVFEIAIRYQRGGAPLALRTLSVPAWTMPDLPARLATRSIATVMAELDLSGGSALQTFRATGASASEARQLTLAVGAPVMVWSGVLYAPDAVARAHVLTVFRGDRITFAIRQGRPVVATVGDRAGGAPDGLNG